MVSVAVHEKLVVVVADEARLDNLPKLAKVFLVGRDRVPLGSELIIAGVRGKQVDPGEVLGIPLSDPGDQLADVGKQGRAGLVDGRSKGPVPRRH